MFLFKKCSKCLLEKEINYFVNNKNSKDGKSSWCKDCKKSYDLIYNTKPEIKEKIKTFAKSDSERNRKYKQKGFKLEGEDFTVEHYNKLMILQNGLCAICNKTEEEEGIKFMVDHCHKSNQVRGLLCNNCNAGLGRFKDNVNLLNKAIKYLLK